MHRESQYLLHHHQQQQQQNPRSSAGGFELDKPDLALHYPPHLQNPQYSLFQAQSLLPTHKPLPYDYNSYPSTLPSDSPAIAAKQLMTNPRDCESGSEGLRYQVPEPAGNVEVGTCEPAAQEMGAGRDHDQGMSEWGVIDRLVATSHIGNEESSKGIRFEDANAQSVHQINQLSLRGEMDFWGYAGK